MAAIESTINMNKPCMIPQPRCTPWIQDDPTVPASTASSLAPAPALLCSRAAARPPGADRRAAGNAGEGEKHHASGARIGSSGTACSPGAVF